MYKIIIFLITDKDKNIVKKFRNCMRPPFTSLSSFFPLARNIFHSLNNIPRSPNKEIVIANDPYTGAVVPHFLPVVRKENDLIAVPLESIVGRCFHMNCGNENT